MTCYIAVAGLKRGDSWWRKILSLHLEVWANSSCRGVMGWKEYGWRLFTKNPSLEEATEDPCSWSSGQADPCKRPAPAVFFIDLLLGYWRCFAQTRWWAEVPGRSCSRELPVASDCWMWEPSSLVPRRDKLWVSFILGAPPQIRQRLRSHLKPPPYGFISFPVLFSHLLPFPPVSRP